MLSADEADATTNVPSSDATGVLHRISRSAFDGVPTDVLRSKVDGKVEQFEPTIDLLAEQGWLIVMGEAPQQRYRLNFRAKRGSRSSFNLWSILTDRLPDDWKGMVKPDAT